MRRDRALVLAFAATMTLAACDRPPAAPVQRSTPPVALQTPPPAYPEDLACDDVGGTANLSVTIGVDGAPSALVVRGSSGNEALDAAAVEAVRGWTFRPATRGGQPVASTIAVPIRFRPPQPRPDFCFQLDEDRRNRL